MRIRKVTVTDTQKEEYTTWTNEGEVGASISAICNFAGIRAVDDGCEVTKMEHILEELEAMYNNSSKGRMEKEKERKKIGFC